MRLKNKQTGAIGLVHCDATMFSNKIGVFIDNNHIDLRNPYKVYDSLAELNAEWEDAPEEPKEYWYIDCYGTVIRTLYNGNEWDERRKLIGNRFETEEEAEEAIEKLKAWTRLEDKGFKFTGWEDLQAKMDIDDQVLFNRDVIDADNVIGFRMDDYHDCIKDLNILFGGEE